MNALFRRMPAAWIMMVLSVVLLGLPVPSSASAEAARALLLPGEQSRRLAEGHARSLIEALRTAGSTQSVKTLVSSGLGRSGRPTPSSLVPPTLEDDFAQDVAGVARPSVAELVQAVGRAKLLLPDADHSTLRRTLAQAARGQSRIDAALKAQQPGTAAGRVFSPTKSPRSGRAGAARSKLSAKGPDAKTTAAALLLADAVDKVLLDFRVTPHMKRNSSSKSGKTVQGCDEVDALPVLCIGSEADNTYDENAAILVDLGGNDVYMNTAGGAPFALDATTFSRISINIDLAGDDEYRMDQATPILVETELTPPALRRRLVVGGGAASAGAVGLAVDVAGDDSYTTSNPVSSDTASRNVLRSIVS